MIRWFTLVSLWYAGYLAATVLLVSLPTLIVNWRLEREGIWEIHPWGVMPQSPDLTEWVSNAPRSVLLFTCVSISALAFIARLLVRILPAGGAVLLCAGALLTLLYWLPAFTIDRFAGAAGIGVSMIAAAYEHNLAIPDARLRYWERFIEVWLPLGIGCALCSLLALGASAWIVGLAGASALGVAGLLGAARQNAGPWRAQ